MQLRLRALAAGTATFMPFVGKYACRGTGGTASARYCYSVWMRHLVKAQASGFSLAGTNGRIAELGPGDSLGIGLAAMLSGYNEYFALDVKAHANIERNLSVLEQLARLFSERAPIPGDEEFPLTFPKLEDYSFPGELLTDAILSRVLDAERVEAIARAVREPSRKIDGAIRIAYIVPWTDKSLLEPCYLDVAFSQAVLEHVNDIAATYETLRHWLRPRGFMSHTIDYMSHGLTRDWNGHWTIGDACWRIVQGTRPYLINRLPHSAHLREIKNAGFHVILDETQQGVALNRKYVAKQFRGLSDADLRTCGSFIQALKLVEHS